MKLMKHIFSLIFAGVVGGLSCFGAIYLFNPPTQQNIYSENQAPKAIFTSDNSTPSNFTMAATKAIPAVVHITASESELLAQNRTQKKNRGQQNPFGDMFGFDIEDFFGQGLGQNFYGPKEGTGSGVIISEDGYIVTNNHVVGFADEIKVVLSDDREYLATKVGTDPSSDLAVLKIEASNLPTMEFGNSDQINIGEWVLAVGNPFSYLESTVTAGIVSAKGRDLDIIKGEKTIEEFIQTDAAVNPGNSGGALVDTEGNLIGINTAIASPTGNFAGYSFAIPINLAKEIIADIQINGDIERANLGIRGYDIDQTLMEEKDLDVNSGIFVVEVDNGSGAQFSGILPGDIVVQANNRKVNSFEDIKQEMQLSKVGDTIRLEVIRNGKKMTIPVKIKKRA